jgi:sulfite exporter TauE/SafE
MIKDGSVIAIYGGLLLAGLVSSLHCIGMCGPLLIGFSQVFERQGGRRGLAMDFAWYHAGRIWTYAMLGFAAGLVGAGVRHGSAVMGWHRTAGIGIGVVVILSGIALLGVIPGLKMEAMIDGCAVQRWRRFDWFRALLAGRGALPRLLLGVVMGFLPCGLVYAMLAVVAALPTPWHAAGGMIVFGIGTLPSLTAVLAASHLVPATWRAHGTTVAAVIVVLTGAWMIARAALPHEHGDDDHQHHNHSQHAAKPPATADRPQAATASVHVFLEHRCRQIPLAEAGQDHHNRLALVLGKSRLAHGGDDVCAAADAAEQAFFLSHAPRHGE